MKTYLVSISIALGFCLPSACGQNIVSPVQHFASARGLTSDDSIRKVEADLNGDGLSDMLLAYEDPNPDIVERQARRMERGVVYWDAYVKGPGGNYTLSIGVDKGGELNVGAGVPFRPDEVHLGNVSEISRFAFVAFYLSNIKSQSSMVALVAYTWEGDHFKEHQLAQYVEGDQNTVFDKYLAPDKRTPLTVQEVSP